MNARIELPTRPIALFATFVSGVIASAVLGALTNAINGAVSPAYFVINLRFDDGEHLWRACIAQGVLEGIAFGVAFSLIFAIGVGVITRAACTYTFALRHLSGIVLGGMAGSLIGGVLAMLLALLSPPLFRDLFRAPADFGALLRYAWVGGSILGLQVGGFVCLIVGLIVLRANWQKQRPGRDSDSAGEKSGTLVTCPTGITDSPAAL